MTKELIVEVGFTTDPMGEISHFGLDFSEKDLQLIKKHQIYLHENPDIFKVVMFFDGECFADEDKTPSDFKTDGGELFIFKERIYYYTQSRYDASYQYESQEITNEEIFGEDDLEELDNAYRSSLTCNICASDVDLCECQEMTVDNAREFLKEKGYFTQNLWTTDDVIGTGENMDIEISEEQAKEIFDLLGRRHDATIGVNWDMIEAVIEEYFND
jgi:hypothetical protein